jgi:hypothetical protein
MLVPWRVCVECVKFIVGSHFVQRAIVPHVDLLQNVYSNIAIETDKHFLHFTAYGMVVYRHAGWDHEAMQETKLDHLRGKFM